MRSELEFLGFEDDIFFYGVVEDRNDPLKVGRVKVRCFGIHTADKQKLPTEKLQWAEILQPVTSAANSGVGWSPTGLQPGTWVFGVMMDGEDCQHPLVLGVLPGIHKNRNLAPPGVPEQNRGNQRGGGGGGGGLPLGGNPPRAGTNPTTGQPVLGEDSIIRSLGMQFNNPNAQANLDAAFISGGGTITPMQAAQAFTGMNEHQNTTALANFFAQSGGQNLNPSQTAWCAAFMNASLGEAGLLGTGSLMAQSFATYGEAREGAPQVGDIVVFDRGGGSGHVGFYAGTDANGRMLVLGGNQSDSVNITAFSTGNLMAVRVPPEANSSGVDWIGQSGGEITTDANLINEQALPENQPGFDPENPVETPQESVMPTGFEYNRDPDVGFQDPNGQYPTYPSEDHSTDPNARGLTGNGDPDGGTWDSSATDVNNETHEAQRDRQWSAAGGGDWAEPRHPAAGQYPYNTVLRTESGMFVEFDSTQGAERFHIFHPSGSYIQFDQAGNLVSKAHGDRVEINNRNRTISTQGDFSLTSRASLKLKSEGDAVIEVTGNLSGAFENDFSLTVLGSLTLNATERMKLSAHSVLIEATGDDINMKASKEFNTESTAETNLQSGDVMALQSGAAMLLKSAQLMAAHAGGDMQLGSKGAMSLKSDGDLKMEGADVSYKGDTIKMDGEAHVTGALKVANIISSPQIPQTPAPSGAGPAGTAGPTPDDAGETTKNRGTENEQRSRGDKTAANSKVVAIEDRTARTDLDRPAVPSPQPGGGDDFNRAMQDLQPQLDQANQLLQPGDMEDIQASVDRDLARWRAGETSDVGELISPTPLP